MNSQPMQLVFYKRSQNLYPEGTGNHRAAMTELKGLLKQRHMGVELGLLGFRMEISDLVRRRFCFCGRSHSSD
jgi:hypothetical protein